MKQCLSLLTAAATIGMLMVPTFAATLKSVAAKPAPPILEVQNENNESVSAIVKGTDNKEVVSLKKEAVKTTPMADLMDVDFDNIDSYQEPTATEAELSDAELELYSAELEGMTAEEQEVRKEEIKAEVKADKVAAKKNLAKAFKQVSEVENVAVLAEDFDTVLAQAAPDSKIENMIVKDMFDVSIPRTVLEEMKATGSTIQLTFNPDIPADVPMLVMHNYEADKWEVIPNDRVQRNDDGSVMITFTSLSPIAFVVDKTLVEIPVVENPFEVTESVAPAAESGVNVLPIVIVAAVVVAGVAFFLVKKNKDGTQAK